MKDIKDLHVIQIRIFPVGTIPYAILCVPSKLTKFKDLFHFGSQEIPFPLYDPSTPNVIIFNSGEVTIDERCLIIDRLAFEGRKLSLDVSGDSKDGDFAFQQVAKFVNELTGRDDMNEENCLVKTQETKCMVNLDVNFWELFDARVEKFINNNLPDNLDAPILSIEPRRLTFEIMFKQREDLEKEKIALSPKPLTIEPFEATLLEKRIFHTHTPFDSDTHLQVLSKFESTFSSTLKLSKRRKGV